MSMIMDSGPPPSAREECYAYMFKFGEHRLLFIDNFGSGVESVAQLVHDVDSKENLIRKVTARRLIKNHSVGENWALLKPREIMMLDTIKQNFKPPEPGFPVNIAECYGHHYIKSRDRDSAGRSKYHSVSYWKLYNGRSLYKRWLTADILPPVTAVARMIRQILGTLHYLYTAGEQPIYHGDVHFGNIWTHWRADALLPDFYLGDFSDAGFADSQYHMDTVTAWLGLPVKDLHKFWHNLEMLCQILGERRGFGNHGVKELRRLSEGISQSVVSDRNAGSSDPPPDLRPLIRWAQEVENIFGEGGEADETSSEAYIRYVTEDRNEGLRIERERALVVSASQKDALRPGYAQGLAHIPLAIHGPWQLVRAPDWTLAEGDHATHHRPNRTRITPGEGGLSHTQEQPGAMGAAFIEPDIGNTDAGSYTSLLHADLSPKEAQEASPTVSWTAGHDAEFQQNSSPDGPRAASDDHQYLSSPASSITIRAVPRATIHQDGLDVQSKNSEPSGKDYEDWQLFNDQREARVASYHRAPPIGTRPARINRLPFGLEEVVVPTVSVLEPVEDKLQHWHKLLHGDDCKCADHIWQADMEAMLNYESTRMAVAGMKEADWRFQGPAGLNSAYDRRD